jgi:hypothetical protein
MMGLGKPVSFPNTLQARWYASTIHTPSAGERDLARRHDQHTPWGIIATGEMASEHRAAEAGPFPGKGGGQTHFAVGQPHCWADWMLDLITQENKEEAK